MEEAISEPPHQVPHTPPPAATPVIAVDTGHLRAHASTSGNCLIPFHLRLICLYVTGDISVKRYEDVLCDHQDTIDTVVDGDTWGTSDTVGDADSVCLCRP